MRRQQIIASLVALIGSIFLVVGLVFGGTDLIDGIVIGVLALLVAAAMLSRRGPKSPEPMTLSDEERE